MFYYWSLYLIPMHDDLEHDHIASKHTAVALYLQVLKMPPQQHGLLNDEETLMCTDPQDM